MTGHYSLPVSFRLVPEAQKGITALHYGPFQCLENLL